MGMLIAGIHSIGVRVGAGICCIMGRNTFRFRMIIWIALVILQSLVGWNRYSNNKCSWLVVQALEAFVWRSAKCWNRTMVSGTTKKSPKGEELYNKLDLVKVFEEYEQASYKDI
jgi:hypothetical protein